MKFHDIINYTATDEKQRKKNFCSIDAYGVIKYIIDEKRHKGD